MQPHNRQLLLKLPFFDAPEAEKVETCEKEAVLPEPVKGVAVEDEKKVTASTSFKEESNVVGELPDLEKKALDELKVLVQEALNKHKFTAPPRPVKEEEKPVEEKGEAKACEDLALTTPVTEAVVECKEEDNVTPPPAAEPSEEEVTEVMKIEPPKAEETEKPTPPPCTAEDTPASPEEVSIWGIPLLADERSDVILMKFLRARDFKVKDAFTMLKNVVAWWREFGIESLLEEDLGTEQEKVVYMSTPSHLYMSAFLYMWYATW